MGDRLRVVMLGNQHHHANGIISQLLDMEDIYEVVGYTGDKTKSMYSKLKYFDSDEQALDTANPDAVFVETEVNSLVKTAGKAVERGIPVHMDKPAGQDIKSYSNLLNTALEKKLALQLGYMYRYNPAVIKSMEMIKAGKLGEIYEVSAIMNTEHSKGYRQWLKSFNGGVMYIMGCHLVDLVLLFNDKKKINSDCTYPKIYTFNHSIGLDGINALDYGLAVFDYEKSASTIHANSIEANGYNRRQLVICGTKGTIEIRPLDNQSLQGNKWDIYSDCLFESPSIEMTFSERDEDKAYVVHKEKISLEEGKGRYYDMLLDFSRKVRNMHHDQNIIFPYDYAERVRNNLDDIYDYKYETELEKYILKAINN